MVLVLGLEKDEEIRLLIPPTQFGVAVVLRYHKAGKPRLSIEAPTNVEIKRIPREPARTARLYEEFIRSKENAKRDRP